MRTKSRVFMALFLAGALASTALGPAGASHVTTNALRDNAAGTVPLITVTPLPNGSLTASCPSPAAACTISMSVHLDRADKGVTPLNVEPVYLFLLNGSAPADIGPTDCSRTIDIDNTTPGIGRTELTRGEFAAGSSVVTLVVNKSVPFGKWSYGKNWLCATTVLLGGTGGIGDHALIITP